LPRIKHETNTFSPVTTPISSFGHGEGPQYLRRRRDRRACAGRINPSPPTSTSPNAEGAEIVVPIVRRIVAVERDDAGDLRTLAEAARRRRARRLRRAVPRPARRDGGRGLLRCRRRAAAPRARDRAGLPIAVTLDYHTNLSSTMVENATVITG